MALAIDGTPKTGLISGAATNTCASGAFTTTNTNDVVVAIVGVANGTAVSVSSMAGASLSWAKRKAFAITTSSFNHGSLEIWWAAAASAITSQVITATLSGNSDACGIMVFAVSGANTTTPWDPASTYTGSNVTGTSTDPTVTGVSTTNANTVLITAVQAPGATLNGGSAPTVPSGFTQIAFFQAFSGSPNFFNDDLGGARDIVSSSQSNITVAYGSASGNWAMLVDAIQAAGTTGSLFRPPNLDGLSTGGPFFANPLNAPCMSPRMRTGWRKPKRLLLPDRMAA